ncbi:hypothetical protein V6N11_025169 [Hibiscus sabdariffa]|uniref:Uncharacterized protein n=1 Tax=Hibiscus sabdariffa TaxID=183260 RepID=A0ABR2QPJ0_9ROSI
MRATVKLWFKAPHFQSPSTGTRRRSGSLPTEQHEHVRAGDAASFAVAVDVAISQKTRSETSSNVNLGGFPWGMGEVSHKTIPEILRCAEEEKMINTGKWPNIVAYPINVKKSDFVEGGKGDLKGSLLGLQPKN